MHCRLTAAASDQLVVEDLKSTNGTLVNGKPVERSVLKTGDVLTVGRVEFRVFRADAYRRSRTGLSSSPRRSS